MKDNLRGNNSTSLYVMSVADDIGALVESIKPGINIAYKSANRKTSLLLFLLIVSIITLIGPIIFLLIMISFDRKAKNLKLVMDLQNEIEKRDKTSLDDLFLSSYIEKNSVILIINKLIETGNLRYYEVIGNAGIAKIELRAKESDFPPLAVSEISDALRTATEKINVHRVCKCPNCGAVLSGKPEDCALLQN